MPASGILAISRGFIKPLFTIAAAVALM